MDINPYLHLDYWFYFVMFCNNCPSNNQSEVSAAEQCLQLRCGGICQDEFTYLSNSLSNRGIYSKLSLIEELNHDGMLNEKETQRLSKKLSALLLPTEYSCCNDSAVESYEYIQMKNLIKDCSQGKISESRDDCVCTCIDSEGKRAGGDNCRLLFNASFTLILEVFQTITNFFESTCKSVPDADVDHDYLTHHLVEAVNCRREGNEIPVRRSDGGKGAQGMQVVLGRNVQEPENLKQEAALNHIADATDGDGARPMKRSSFFANTKRLSQSFYR